MNLYIKKNPAMVVIFDGVLIVILMTQKEKYWAHLFYDPFK